MGQLIIVTGKAGSGKSQWIEKWRRDDPENRVRVDNMHDAARALEEGKDCAIEIIMSGAHGVRIETIA